MISISLNNTSTVQPIADTLINRTVRRCCPMGFAFSERVLRGMGRSRVRLATASDEVQPSERGYLHQYYCPTCGKKFWATETESKQPLITCRRCSNADVQTCFNGLLAEMVSRAYVAMIAQNYDKLSAGEATLPKRVCRHWVRDPAAFVAWTVAQLKDKRVSAVSGVVWLITNKDRWDERAIVSTQLNPPAPRIKIL